MFQAGRHVNDLFEDLQDGHNLISLLEVLSQETLPRERGQLRFHMLHNVQVRVFAIIDTMKDLNTKFKISQNETFWY